jgi:hypothetical protein
MDIHDPEIAAMFNVKRRKFMDGPALLSASHDA